MGLTDSRRLIETDVRVTGMKLYKANLHAAEKATDKFGKSLGSIVGGAKNTRLSTYTNETGQSVKKMSHDFTTSSGAVVTATSTMKKGLVSTKTAASKFGDQVKTSSGLMAQFGKAMKRVLIVVPLWGALRMAMQSVTKIINDITTSNREFIKTMGRVATVTLATGASMEEFNLLTQRAIEVSRTSTLKLKDMATAMYTLATSGLNAKQTMEGFTAVVELAEGTLTGIEQTGKLVAGAFNLFGKEMKSAGSIAERFRKISDTLAYTFSTQQVELSEIATAFRYAGAASNSINFGFQELVGTVGFLNTGMLKGCVSSDTEVLTDQGWKLFKDLNKNEKIATLNIETGELEYQIPTRYIDYVYKGKMLHQKNTYMDTMLTPNHRIFARKGQKSCVKRQYIFQSAEEIYNTDNTYLRGAKWVGKEQKYFILPEIDLCYGGYNKKSGIKKINMDLWLQFLGWYLSEGCSSFYEKNNNTQYKVIINQKKEKNRKEIMELVQLMGFNGYFSKNGVVINSKQLFNSLKVFGKSYEKYAPNYVKELTPEQIKLFLITYNKGDGSNRSRTLPNIVNGYEITTASTQMRDDLMELGFKAGYGVSYAEYHGDSSFNQNHRLWKVYASNRIEFSFSQKKNNDMKKYNYNRKYNSTTKEEWVDYNDHVYCVEVPNSTIFIRRNGKTLWSGNSKSGTALTNAIIKASKNIRGLERATGRAFDSDKPLEFVKLMGALNERYGDSKVSIEDNTELIQLFGIRGVRAIQQIIQRYGDWDKAINVSSLEIDGQARKLKEVLTNNTPRQLELLKSKWLSSWAEMGEAINKAVLPGLKGINKILDTIEKRKTIELIMQDITGIEKTTSALDTLVNTSAKIDITGFSALQKALYDIAKVTLPLKGMEEFEKNLGSFTQNELANFQTAIHEVANESKKAEFVTLDLARAYLIEKDNLGKLIEEGKKLPDIGKDIQDRFGRLFDKNSLTFLKKITEEYVKQAQITKDEAKNEKEKVARFKDIADLKAKMSATGYTELEIEKKTLDFMINRLKMEKKATDVKEQNKKIALLELSYTRQLVDEKLQRLQAAGATEIEMAEHKIRLLLEETNLTRNSEALRLAGLEKELALIKERTARVNQLKSATEGAIKIGLEEGDFNSFLDKFREGMRTTMLDSLSAGLNKALFNITGLGDAMDNVFKMAEQTLPQALDTTFKTAEQRLPQALDTAFEDGGTSVATKITTALSSASLGGSGGAGAQAWITAGSSSNRVPEDIRELYPRIHESVPVAPDDYYKTRGMEDAVEKGTVAGQKKSPFNMQNFGSVIGVGLLAAGLLSGGKSKGSISQKYSSADAFNGISGTSDATTRSSTRAKITNITIKNDFSLDGLSLNDQASVASFADTIKLIEKQIFDKLAQEGISSGNY